MSLETSLAECAAAYWRAIATAVQICAAADAPTLYSSRIDGLLMPRK